jgi:hypothetical protein
MILNNNSICFENIDLLTEIYNETRKEDKNFLEEDKKYYLVTEDKPD